MLVAPDTRLPQPSPSAIFRPLPEGGVLFSTDSEVYFGVNEVGARLWQMLPPVCHGFEEMCAKVSVVYPDAGLDLIRRDARQFVDELVANGLAVKVVDGDDATPPSGS